MYAYIDTYIHTYIHAYIRDLAVLHANALRPMLVCILENTDVTCHVCTCVCNFMHACICMCMLLHRYHLHTCIHAYIHTLKHCMYAGGGGGGGSPIKMPGGGPPDDDVGLMPTPKI